LTAGSRRASAPATPRPLSRTAPPEGEAAFRFGRGAGARWQALTSNATPGSIHRLVHLKDRQARNAACLPTRTRRVKRRHKDRQMRHHHPNQADLFGPPPKQSAAIGTLVRLDRTSDRLKPCHANTAILLPGTGPHAAELACAVCGSHRGWATKSTVNFIEQLHRMFGRGDALPIIRDHQLMSAA
jgi:hypothetical protein